MSCWIAGKEVAICKSSLPNICDNATLDNFQQTEHLNTHSGVVAEQYGNTFKIFLQKSSTLDEAARKFLKNLPSFLQKYTE